MSERLTKKSFEKLKKKLEELKKRRPVISKAIGEAREHGDLKENSAYHAAKEEQGLNEMRVRELEAKLSDVTIVDEKDLAQNDMVRLGSTVKIKAVASGEEFEYTLVSAMEADILESKISPDSPLGGELVKRKEGEVIEVEAPAGLIKYKILEIK
ncbi:MAG: transcription elongation factor GreA [Candidatus Margulisiibacteriota bacterium]|nr:transcription elongation factor GreA [Candidatus Margulisiibacteriota bacterium]